MAIHIATLKGWHLSCHFFLYKDSGYVLLIDFSKYFDSIRHDKTMEMFEKYIDDKNVIQLLSYLVSTFDTDTVKGKGVGIGSQISQEIGIAYPIPIDNYCKIVKGCKYYGRYMDDTYVIHNDKKFLQNLLKEINNICGELEIVINKKKTQIVKLSNGFRFLKMRYKFTPTGKIVVVPDRKSMTRERRKLKKLKIKLDSRKISYEEIEGQYKSWRGGLSKYNSYRSLQNADRLYMELFNRRIIWTKKKNRSVRKSTLKSDALSHSSQPRQAQLATGRLSSATRQN